MSKDPTVEMIEQLRDRALGRTTSSHPLDLEKGRAEMWRHLSAAAENASVDELPVPSGRLVGLKRVVLKAGAFSWTRQRTVNRALAGALAELANECSALHHELVHERRRTAATLAALEARIDRHVEIEMLTRRVDTLHAAVEEISSSVSTEIATRLEDAVAPVTERLDAEHAEIVSRVDAVDGLVPVVDAHEARLVHLSVARRTIERQVAALAHDIARLAGGQPHDLAATHELLAEHQHDLEALYARFEDEFRSGSEALREEMRAYLPDLEHLRESNLRVIDIGCGRGDWLRVLGDSQIAATGVDSSAEAVEEAAKSGCDAVLADGIEYLRSLKPESVGAVTAFHVVEHLAPHTLVDLVDAALRALAPGGVVIVETPNPTNLVVGASAFYRDPTHVRPLNPEYLSFLVRDRGFVAVETRFLHPRPEYELTDDLSAAGGAVAEGLLADLRWALHGPQDFAIVARRPPTAE